MGDGSSGRQRSPDTLVVPFIFVPHGDPVPTDLAPDGGEFSAVAATLDPECVLYQPTSLPMAANGARRPASRPGCRPSASNGSRWR